MEDRTIPAGPAQVEIRAFAGDGDYEACEDMQRRVWGAGYTCVPAALLKVAGHVGAIAAGAYDGAGTMVGFVFGLTGVDPERPPRIVHWSHMLAVDPGRRDRGIGSQLKAWQIARARELGAERVDWTFDPLVARNGHINVNRLAVHVRAYVQDMYSGTGSDLHAFGTDRLIVSLPLNGAARHRSPPPDADASTAPFLNDDAGAHVPSGAYARIRIPADITAIAACDPAAARAWRASTRAAFTRALAAGYGIVQLRAEEDGTFAYVLARVG